jgi:hypothetical protein
VAGARRECTREEVQKLRTEVRDLLAPQGTKESPVTAVRVQGDEIIQIFGKDSRNSATEQPPSNYMAYHGGILRFGRLTMDNVDMLLIDADPTDPFDSFPDHYNEQLVAGYSKTTASGGLRVYMPDYNKISRPLSLLNRGDALMRSPLAHRER